MDLMRLLLIRHGQTPSNVRGLLDTAVPGPGLTALGQRQAAALPDSLAGQRIDAIYASSQLRAQLTAAPLATARDLPVQIRDGLREVDAGDLEMLGDERSTRWYQRTVRRWMAGELDETMPGGPSGAEVLARFDAVVADVLAELRRTAGEGGCAVLVAHGAVLRFWATFRASELAAVEDALGRGYTLHNTGMIVLQDTADGGWRVVSWAGRAIGGPALDDGTADGPAGESFADAAG
jgi:probable phosphoglycerate mutase